MPQLLLELLSEEIPARMQAAAARDLERMVRERLAEQGLLPEALTAFAGPRRLTLVAEGLPPAQPDRSEQRKGPRATAPDAAVQGFLRSTGLTREELTERDGVLYATLHRPGRPTPELIAEIVPAVVRAFPWPKSMRSGAVALRWVRPLKRIVCTFDGEVVPFDIDGLPSGDLTEGHRFMGSRGKPFRVRRFEDYAAGLEREFVVLDPDERRLRILNGARTLCFARGLDLVDDPGLLDEVAGLAEWPTPVLGDMDRAFLDLPPEVIRTSMRTHQKFFAVRRPGENLAPHFVTVANIEAPDGGATIAAGNAKVLSARLSDARFFWDEDLKVPLEARLEKLRGVTFHAKLGAMYERVERIEALAREIAPLVGADPDLAARAARLCKADLATAMVGEFPELQGVMGGYYVRAQSPFPLDGGRWPREAGSDGGGVRAADALPVGAKSAASGDATPIRPSGPPSPIEGEGGVIADAVRDHYKPQGPADAVPTAPVTVAVALADKLDTLVGFFAIDEKPTGSRDPFALRRAALGVIRIVLENGVRANLYSLADQAMVQFPPGLVVVGNSAEPFAHAVALEEKCLGVVGFIYDRLKVSLRDQGQRPDLFAAVAEADHFADHDLVQLTTSAQALSAFLAADDGANLLAGYRRAVNILKAEAKKGDLPAGPWADHPDAAPQERALHAALTTAVAALEPALAAEDFAAAMAALSRLRAPVDAFFEAVLVNAPDPDVRAARLRLLAEVQAAMNRVADFSLVSGG